MVILISIAIDLEPKMKYFNKCLQIALRINYPYQTVLAVPHLQKINKLIYKKKIIVYSYRLCDSVLSSTFPEILISPSSTQA